ncbi:MAG: hypothetical protein KUG74_09390 [Rhodobacteraceae bacterium]|nr:hypothetical protein [Paracoccaceae bacterium]
MAFEVILTNQTTTYDIHDTDEVVLLKDTNIVVTSGHAINGNSGADTILDSVELYAHGDVIAQDDGINFLNGFTEANNIHIVLAAQATLTAGGDGIVLRGGVNNRVINYGQIIADEASVYVSGGEIDFQNYGSIVTSDGGSQNSVYFSGTARGTDIRQFSNVGTISGFTSTSITTAVVFNGASAEFIGSNSGTIAAGGGLALFSSATTNSFFNTGVIDGSIRFDSTANLTNTGLIDGDVTLSGISDSFDGRGGDVYGSVAGGDGDDTYVVDDTDDVLVENAAEGTDTVEAKTHFTLGDNFENLTLIGGRGWNGVGNGEANTITGNSGDNRLQGLSGGDSIFGGAGADRLLGNVGKDTLFGGTGDDFIRGGVSVDRVYGGDDDDLLFGNRSDDFLFGGEGEDRLVGGLGADDLTGGNGQDVFVYNRRADSVWNGAEDKILDFSKGTDLIDFTGLAPTLTYSGSSFSGSGGGEVRRIGAGANTKVQVDLDGNGTADMEINVIGVLGLSVDDFLL